MIARLPLLALALLVSACVTDRSFTSGVNDTAVDISLKNALLRDVNYDTQDVDITVFEGRVLLSGTVRSVEARRDLTIKANSLTGVEEVINELIVGGRTSIPQGTRDAVIDSRLGTAMRADNGIYRNNYQFSVSNGVVYLLGVAQGPTEYDRVLGHAQSVPGVKDVVSHVVFVGDPRRPGQTISQD